ncbi:glycosyltransferase, group 1 family protein [Hoylesella buccalis ATCC 35310]|uniref:Glycosyltransferase, group 1 family protein n=1 Tax=Hoylesella buccalis ATCC 35310 TaxID=679190 RepID=D1W6W4_9BACT|nr:glycosyltransferase [Hoylesella buccalis]EFA91734.1 glycosyltransferase, group 1 family protein [Hoylesella buccalis ATCC 35310]
MRKKVLFIIGTLQSGGVSKSMVSLLTAWDRQRYDTSLLLCCKEGDIYSDRLPKDVHLIYNPVIEHVMGGVSSAWWLLRHGKVMLALGVLIRLLLSRLSKPMAGRLIAKMMPAIDREEYDLIVDFGGQQILYYMVDKLRGKKKISFFHSDYAKWDYYYKVDKNYYPQVDQLFTISETCATSLKKYFPLCEDKIAVMENISSPVLINSLARENVKLPQHELIITTIGHVWYNKGIDLAIEAAQIIHEETNIDFLWIFIGAIRESKWLHEIERKDLSVFFMFTGIKSNPYPYLFQSDLYVHPSRFEGKSIALDEAKILCKPIVVTNFSTAHDQFENGVNGSICEMSGRSIADAIINLYLHPQLRNKYSKCLQQHIVDNSCEVKKLYKFL